MNANTVQLSEDGAVRANTAPPGGGGVAGLGLVETWRALNRRRWTILLIALLGVILAALAISRIPPQYSAKATVLLDPRKSNVVDFEEVLSGLPADDDTVNSEILVVRSPVMVARAARFLGLQNDPEFDPDQADDRSLLSRLNPFGENGVLPRGATAPQPEEALLRARAAAVIEKVTENLTVSRSGRSRAIDIRFVSRKPETAAKVANALADAYLSDQLQAKAEATRQAQAYLDFRVNELRQQVQNAERAIEEYRVDAGLVGTSAGTVAVQQLSGLNTQLVLAETQRAEAEARLRQVRRLAANGAGGAESSTEVLASPLIVDLRGRETDAERKIAELSQEYGERHPRMIAARAEFRDIQARIADEISKIVASFENEVAVARARAASLASSVRSLERTAAAQGAAEVQMRALEREADAARELFQQFLTRSSETATQADIQRPDARVLARAAVPTKPAFPKPGVILPIVGLLSLFIGMAIALLLEQLDRGYRSGDEIERETGVGVLALAPLVSRRRRLTAAPEQYVLDRPTSSFAEALRSIDTGVRLSNVDRTPRSVMITSSIPKEGKSTLAMSLSRMLARSGRSVLLIDADLRRPRVAKALGLPASGGLVDVLTEAADIESVLKQDAASGLYVITAGDHDVASPPDLLGSRQMHDLLRELEGRFELVIVDSAPILVVSDSRALARHVDSVVFVARWASTRREVVQTGLKQLRESGARIAGVVLSAVNVRRHSQYGYGDSGYYYGAARGYYKD